jgi:hypothetical protein
VEQAIAHGALRADVTASDVGLLTFGVARVAEMTREVAADQWERTLTLALEGLRAATAPPVLTTAPLSPAELRTAFDHWAQRALLPAATPPA